MELITLSKKEFKRVFSVVKVCNKNNVIEKLRGVYINNNEVIACDGSRLSMRKIENYEVLDNVSCVIPVDAIKQALKGITKEVSTVQIQFNNDDDDNYIQYFDKNKNFISEFKFNLISGSYVNYQHIIPSKEDLNNIEKIYFNAEELKEKIQNNAFKFKSYNINKICIGGKNIYIQNKFLKAALKGLKDGYIYADIKQQLPALYIINNNDIEVILPVRYFD